MESNGDAPISAILTRSKKLQNGGDEFSMLKNISEEQHEVKSLIQDQIYHNFVEKMVDPNEGPLKESVGDEDDFVPEDKLIEEAEDGGSSEDELDDDEPLLDEAEILVMCKESGVSTHEFLSSVPPASKVAYKKRFPNFWRTHQTLNTHSGLAYEQEDDPDFSDPEKEVECDENSDEVKDQDETLEEDSDSSEDSDEEEMSKEDGEKEINDLSAMVEDMIIPDDSIIEVEDSVEIQDESEEEEDGEDDGAAAGPTIADLVNEKNDGVYDDDGDYKPTEEQVSTSEDEMSSDSFVSATEDSDDDEEENTAMDE